MVEDNFKELVFNEEINSSNNKILSSKIFPRLEFSESEKCSIISFLFIVNFLNKISNLDIMEGEIREFSFCREANRSINVDNLPEISKLNDVTSLNFGSSDKNRFEIS
jgi:hypothetical protein